MVPLFGFLGLLGENTLGFSCASKEEFITGAKDCGLLAIGETLSSDHQTSVNIADRFVDKEFFFLLESATQGPGSIARYSYIGIDELVGITATGNQVELRENFCKRRQVKKSTESNAVTFVSNYTSSLDVKFVGKSGLGVEADLFLSAGATGYISYDFCSTLEPSVGEQPPKLLSLPDVKFFIPRTFLVFDQLSQNLHVFRFVLIDRKDTESDLSELYDSHSLELKQIVENLSKGHTPSMLKTKAEPLSFDGFKSKVSKELFLKRVDRCLDEIKSGEIFQIQIGNRLSASTEARPFDLFRHLRKLNPSPYLFFYKFGEHHIMGASPEMMVNLDGQTMTHRPIAGTRKRTWDPEVDVKMIEELVNSEKERAEHIMLVDLARNDIGRVAASGSVVVDDLMVVEKYSHVFHMVSQVRGRVEKGFTAGDAMTASFPNGTVVGAPKVRAMQLIADIEDFSREFYAGSLGVFQFSGDLKSTLLIRTMHVAGGVASTQASAGIVYDSIPEEEWLETRNKMAACCVVIQNTE